MSQWNLSLSPTPLALKNLPVAYLFLPLPTIDTDYDASPSHPMIISCLDDLRVHQRSRLEVSSAANARLAFELSTLPPAADLQTLLMDPVHVGDVPKVWESAGSVFGWPG